MLQAPTPLSGAGFDGFDLRKLRRASPCAGSATSDIIVCGRRRADPRLAPLPDADYAERPVRAATSLGGVATSLTMEQRQLPQGAVSQPVMLHLKLPF